MKGPSEGEDTITLCLQPIIKFYGEWVGMFLHCEP
jgi:hypothetical protein